VIKPSGRAYLVILDVDSRSKTFLEESLEEMTELVLSAGCRIVGHLSAHIPSPSPSHFLREGKLAEVAAKAKEAGANVLYFNVELTPGQARNLERFIKVKPVDRTGLILEIFGRRAQSSEGKLQVELAHLNYILPRLGGLGVVLSRLGGGIGTRGPGETELESDRRKIRKRIQRVKEELEKVGKHRELLRSGRKKKHYVTAAIVGYTNAGKSTLLNALTGADAYVADQLFATLDPKTRMQNVNGLRDVLFIDTVGFIRDLPHTLVEAFHATLEEVAQADVLIHVLDISHPHAETCKRSVEKVLEEIHAGGKPRILALNKADLLNEEIAASVQREWPESVLISAKNKLGLRGLLTRLEALVPEQSSLKNQDPTQSS
jgi:GTP-binding protein HflX